MAELGPLRIKWKLGVLTGRSEFRAALTPVTITWTLSPLTGYSGPRVGHLAPLRMRWTLGRLRGIEHATATPEPLNEGMYNGTTYQVVMTGYHVDLPELLIPARTIDAEEGGIKETRAVTEFLPVVPPVLPPPDVGDPPVPPVVPSYPQMTGIAASGDYGADPAIIFRTGEFKGTPIDSVTCKTEPLSGIFFEVFSAVFFEGQPYILQHFLSEAGSTQFTQSVPFFGPRILQLRVIPDIGYAVVTVSGFCFFGPALVSAKQMRNSGIVDPRGGRLSLLADGSLIVYMTGNRVYKSTDLGVRWVAASGNLPFVGQTLRDVYVATATIWWLVSSAGIWKTTDGGTSWTLIDDSDLRHIGAFAFRGDIGAWSIHGNPSTPNTVIVGMPGRVGRTTNGGADWTVFGEAEGLSGKPVQYRVHQAGTVLLAGIGAFYEQTPKDFVWRSEDNGASWQRAFPGATADRVLDFTSAFGFSSDLVAIGTPKGPPEDDDGPDDPQPPIRPPTRPPARPWVRTVVNYHDVFQRSSLVSVTANVDSTILAGITARAVVVGDKKARVLIRQIKDYRTQKRIDVIASGTFASLTVVNTSLGGLIDITLTARDTNVQQQFHRNRVAQAIPETDTVVGAEQTEGDLVLSMLINEDIRPQMTISWLGIAYTIAGIKYVLSDSSRMMSLNTKVRTFSVPTSTVRDGNTKRLPVFVPPKATAWRAKVRG